MRLALAEADRASRRGDFPVGAVLSIGGRVVGSASNRARSRRDPIAHAETELVRRFRRVLVRREGRIVEVHATLEPCLMCFGTLIQGGVDRIVFACPDPVGGAAHLELESLGEGYAHRRPALEGGLFREEAYDRVTAHMRAHPEEWAGILERFEEMRSDW